MESNPTVRSALVRRRLHSCHDVWRRLAVFALAAVCLACGKKGPPLAPLNIVPQRVDDLTALRRENTVQVAFSIPTRDSQGQSPADIEAVEVYALTGDPVDRNGRRFEDRDFLRYATLVGRIEVEPPPEEPEEPKEAEEKPGGPSAPAPPRPDDPRPSQGERVTLTDQWTDAALTAFSTSERRDTRPPPSVPRPEALAWPSSGSVLSRYYTAVAVSSRGRRGRLAEPLPLPLTDLPPPGSGPEVTYTATSATVTWSVPSTAHVPMFAAAAVDELTPRVILGGATPHTYNVYAWEGTAADVPAQWTALNAEPLESPTLALPALAFGVPRCFAVRVVERAPRSTIEGPMSPPTCLTPVDAFAPEAPRSLAAVGSEGGVSLIWDANAESDLAGYVILRGAAPAEPTQELTSSPIKETTFRDTAAPAGTRFSYVVIAVDTAGNRSRPSNQVEDAAR